MEIHTSLEEIIDTLKKLKDADPADSDHPSLDAAKKQHIVKQDTVTVTILTNLRQGEAEEQEEVATETESATRGSVVLVRDPIVFAPWPVLFGRGEPCDSCQDTAHVVVSCFSCPMTCHKSTGRAKGDLGDEVEGMKRDVACNGCPKLLNVASVLMMSTLVSCVQRVSNDFFLLVVVFLFAGTG